MRRRLTVATVAVTVTGVLVAGVVALLVAVGTVRATTSAELRREADSLALTIEAEAPDARLARLSHLLRALHRPLRLEGAAIVISSRPGAAGRLPAGVPATALDPSVTGPVGGRSGATLWAAAPFRRSVLAGQRLRNLTGVVALTRTAPAGWTAALPWLVLSAAGVAALAGLVADRLAGVMLRPLTKVRAVTRTMASGDLTARVELPTGADPEVSALARSINDLGADLDAARGAQRRFLQAVSHELRTPLTAVRGFAEALEDGTEPDPRRAGAVIGTEARRLQRLVDDLIELGRLEAGRFGLQPGPVLLGDLVSASVAAFEPTAASLGITLETDLSGATAVPVLADADRVTQILADLVDNALAFARRRVTVGVSGPVLWVRDDGPGIPAERLERIWAPGFTDRPRGRPGSGLGLAIVAELAAAMGASVRAVSPLGPDGGTRMEVGWPAGAAPPA